MKIKSQNLLDVTNYFSFKKSYTANETINNTCVKRSDSVPKCHSAMVAWTDTAKDAYNVIIWPSPQFRKKRHPLYSKIITMKAPKCQ